MPPMRARAYIAALPHIVKQQVETFSFRSYVADCLRVLSAGRYYTNEIPRWADFVQPQKQDTRTADEIALDVIRNAGLKFDGQGGETE